MRKNYITRLIFKWRTWKVISLLLLLYLVLSIGYYFLPWSVRKPIYKTVPKLDHILQENGYHLMQSWDTLALFGHDAAIVVDGSDRENRVYAGQPLQQKQERIKVLKNIGYTVGYSEAMKTPLWVTYRIFDIQNFVH